MSHSHDKEPEELEVEAYMDQLPSGPEAPTDKDRKDYLNARYTFVKDQAKRLQLEKAELESVKTESKKQVMDNIRSAFAENYRIRKYCVTELRKLGEKIEDKFIPLSAV